MSSVQKNTVVPLYFNSKDRVNVDDSTTDYKIKLRKSLRNISSIDVSNVGIPRTYTNINKNNSLLLISFRTGIDVQLISITIPHKDYTEIELNDTLQMLLNSNTVSSNIGLQWSITYDSSTKFYELSTTYLGAASITWTIEFTYTPLLDILGIGSGRTTQLSYVTNSEVLVINNTTSLNGDMNRKSVLFNNIHFNITSKILTNDINTSYIASVGKSFNVGNDNDLIAIDTNQILDNYIDKLDIGNDSIGLILHGTSISMSGNASTIVAGAYRDEGFTGSTYTYKTNMAPNYVYTQQPNGAKTKASNPASINGQEGFSVAIDSTASTMVTGAWQDDYKLKDNISLSRIQGAAYIYSWNGLSWIQQKKVLPSNPFILGQTSIAARNQYLGSYVAISGDGNVVAVSGAIETIILVKKLNNWETIQVISSVMYPQFNYDGSILTLGKDMSIFIYKRKNDMWFIFQTITDAEYITGITITGKSIISKGGDGVSIYDEIDGVYYKNMTTPIFIPSGYIPDVQTPAFVKSFGVSTISGDGNTVAIGDPSYTVEVRVATVSPLSPYTQFGIGVGATLTSNSFGNINTVGIDKITNLIIGDLVLVTSSGSMSDVHNGVYIITYIGSSISPWVFTRDTSLDTDQKAVFGFNISVLEGTLKNTGHYIDTISNISQVGKGNGENPSSHYSLITIDITPFTIKNIGTNHGKVWIYTKNNNEWLFYTVITGTGLAVTNSKQGASVKLSDDGQTVAFGGPYYNYGIGGVWVWKLNLNIWTEIKHILTPVGFIADTNQGASISISKYGKTFITGGPLDMYKGAAWVYERTKFSWNQTGSKLVPNDIGNGSVINNIGFGSSVAISHDGNTVAIGGPYYYGKPYINTGATWVFRRVGDYWKQQGPKLVGYSSSDNNQQGHAVSLSGDGNVMAVTGYTTNALDGIYIYNYKSSWVEYSNIPLKHTLLDIATRFESVALSEDGLSLVAGTSLHNSVAVFNYVQSASNVFVWKEYPMLLNSRGSNYGKSVCISADGNTIAVGAPSSIYKNGYVTIWIKVYNIWSRQTVLKQRPFGNSVSLSSDGNILSVGVLSSTTSIVYIYRRNLATQTWSNYAPIIGTPRISAQSYQEPAVAIEYLDSSNEFVLITGASSFTNTTMKNFIGGNYSFISHGEFEVVETFKLVNRSYTIFDLINTLNSIMVAKNITFNVIFNQVNENIKLDIKSGNNTSITFKINSLTTFRIAEFLTTEYINTLYSLPIDFSINNNIIKTVNTTLSSNIIYDIFSNTSFRKYEAGYTIGENVLIDIQLRDERDRIIDLNGADWIMTVYATIQN